jgi:hypothetical protein
MTTTANPALSAARLGRSVWVWPVAGAVLAAWPVWRSFFPETPDIGPPPLRGQVAAALGELVLIGSWIARCRHRIAGFHLPLFAIGFAIIVLIMAGAHGDAPVVDLAALAICWLAAPFLFAGAVLLDGQRAFAAIQGGAVPPVRMLAQAHERIGYWLIGIALIAASMQETPQGLLLAALAVISPGAVLIWAALCDTARSVLARRRVHVGDLAVLPALRSHTGIIFGDAAMLMANWPKVISILPANETKPGEIVAIAAALLGDDPTDAARGVQGFGVEHRVRVPAIKPLEPSAPALRRGALPDRRVMEIGAIESSTIAEDERAPFAEQIAHAATLHRMVLALMEVEPSPRLLGLLVLAKVTRPGATEAVRSLRKSGLAVALAGGEAAPQQQEALAGLGLKAPIDSPHPAIGIVGPGGAALDSSATTIQFGGRLRASEEGADIVIARDDPRTLVDLLQFARDFRRRMPIAIAVANLPGIALLSMALGFVPASPLFVSIIALAGIVLAAGMPQALRLSSTIANEVDEE